MSNNYSISLYVPEVSFSNTSFCIEISESGNNLIKQIEKKEHKTFNKERISTFLLKKVNKYDLFIKQIIISLISSENKKIGYIEFLLIDTSLIKKHNYLIDDFYERKNPEIDSVLNILDKNKDCILNYEKRVVIINKIYVDPIFRGEGFGRYLFNLPVEFLSTFHHIDIDYVFINPSPYIKKTDLAFLKDDPKNIYKNIVSKLLFLIKEAGFYKYSIDNYSDNLFILKTGNK